MKTIERILISFLEGAAIYHIERCETGRDMDAGFDSGEFSGRIRDGEQECIDFLYQTEIVDSD